MLSKELVESEYGHPLDDPGLGHKVSHTDLGAWKRAAKKAGHSIHKYDEGDWQKVTHVAKKDGKVSGLYSVDHTNAEYGGFFDEPKNFKKHTHPYHHEAHLYECTNGLLKAIEKALESLQYGNLLVAKQDGDEVFVEEVEPSEEVLKKYSEEGFGVVGYDEESGEITLDDVSGILNEFKADGEDSEIPDAVGGQTPLRRADKRNPETRYHMQGSSKTPTRSQMMAGIMKGMSKLTDDKLGEFWSKVKGLGVPQMKEDVESSLRKPIKVSAADVDTADVSKLFDGTNLSEEFRTQASDMFKSAVAAKVNEISEQMAIDMSAEVEALREELASEYAEKLDKYLDYVVTEWMKENEVAVESGIKVEQAEALISGLRDLLEDNLIAVPEDKMDVIDGLVEKIEELENRLNEQIESNVEMRDLIREAQVAAAVEEASEGLTESDAARLAELAETVEFKTDEELSEKVKGLRDTFFKDSGNLNEEVDLIVDADDLTGDVQEEVEEEEVPANMRGYVQAIARTVKK